MENLFIQSFMDKDAKTFLEVGVNEDFNSVPSQFNVTMGGTCWITISIDDFFILSTNWGVTESEIQNALQKQFNGTTLIFDVTK